MESLDFLVISSIVGALLPLLLNLIKQGSWSTRSKQRISMAMAVVAAFVTVGAQEGWSFTSFPINELVLSISTIIALSQTTYKGFWEDSAIGQTLTKTFDLAA